ncbi:MAG: hypothetical protein V4525_01000 [Pseudomonadota bacterium]
MRKKWIIISYFSNINNNPASIHIDDRFKILIENEVDCYLVSSIIGKKYSGFFHVRTPSLSVSGLRYELRFFLRSKIESKIFYNLILSIIMIIFSPFLLIEFLLTRNFFLQLNLSWSWAITGGLVAAWIIWKKNIDIIYSTGGSVSSQTAAWIASRLTGKPWISEMQDPLTHLYNKNRPAELRFNLWVEKKIAQQAKKMIFLTENAVAASKKRIPIYANKIIVLRPGLKKINTIDSSQQTQLKFIHLGTLDGTRNLTGFLDGMTIVCKGSSLQWSLELYGHIGKNITKEIDRFKQNANIKKFGKISREKSLDLMCSGAILLLIQNLSEESHETIPSKVYEYLQSGRLILGLIYQNTELRDLLCSHGHYVAEVNNPQAIAEAIDKIFLRFQQAKLHSDIKPYTYTVEDSVKRLIEIANDDS